MPAKSPQVPKYRHYKPKDLAVVRIDGRDHYLGKYGSDASKERYRRVIAEHLVSPLPVVTAPDKSSSEPGKAVGELIVAYWERHVTSYDVKNDRPTSEQGNIRQALRFLRRLYGNIQASDFSPLALKAVRQEMITSGRCRSLINKDVNRIKAVFRWAVENELLPVTVHQALQTVAGLRTGRSEAVETEPIGPVPEDIVEATIPYLSSQVAAMVQFQLLTGVRPGEVTCLRPCDVTISGNDNWVYRPWEHKTEHLDRKRSIPIGPRAQAVLRPWLSRDPNAYCFSPAEVVASRNTNQTPSLRVSLTDRKIGRTSETGWMLYQRQLSGGDSTGLPSGRGSVLVSPATQAHGRDSHQGQVRVGSLPSRLGAREG